RSCSSCAGRSRHARTAIHPDRSLRRCPVVAGEPHPYDSPLVFRVFFRGIAMSTRLLLALCLLIPVAAFAQSTPEPAKPEAKPAAAQPAADAATADEAAKPAEPAAPPKVLIKTNLGDMTVELYPDKTPKTVENFLEYVDSDFYAGTIFHRVIDSFMIQGGGFTKDLRQKQTRAPAVNEGKNCISNLRGTIAMARTMDPNSATAQFFINTVDNKRLD